MKRSRSGQCGFWGSWRRIPPKYRATAISTPDRELVGWPDPAIVVLVMIPLRMALARAFNSAKEEAGLATGTMYSPVFQFVISDGEHTAPGWRAERGGTKLFLGFNLPHLGD